METTMEQGFGQLSQGYSSGIGGLASQGQMGMAQQAISNKITAPPTLTRALSSLEELNKRLAQLAGGIQGIAQQVGGPFPVRGDNAQVGGPASPPSAMEALNSRIDAAHAYISDIEHAQEAIRRSLGG